MVADAHSVTITGEHHGEGVLVGYVIAYENRGPTPERFFLQEARDGGPLVVAAGLELDDVMAALDVVIIAQALLLALDEGACIRRELGDGAVVQCQGEALVLPLGAGMLGDEPLEGRARGLKPPFFGPGALDRAVAAAALEAVDPGHGQGVIAEYAFQ